MLIANPVSDKNPNKENSEDRSMRRILKSMEVRRIKSPVRSRFVAEFGGVGLGGFSGAGILQSLQPELHQTKGYTFD